MQNNRAVQDWNYTAAFAAEHMSEDHVKVVKQKEILQPIKESISAGNDISMYGLIVNRAVKTLNRMMREWVHFPKSERPEAKSDLFHQLIDYCRAKLKLPRGKGWER